MSHPSPIPGVDTLPPPLTWRDEAPAPTAAPVSPGIPPGEMELKIGTKGPVTASRHMRNALVSAIACAVGVIPMLASWSAGWQAFGLGLMMPGAGFLTIGPSGI